MNILKIYEKVNMVQPISQRTFFNHLNDTQTELIDSYGQSYVLKRSTTPIINYDTYSDFPDIADPTERYMALDTGFIYVSLVAPYTAYTEVFQPYTALDDTIMIDEAYHPAIIDNILFFSGAGEIYKSEFLRKAQDAFLRRWNTKARGKCVKRYRW